MKEILLAFVMAAMVLNSCTTVKEPPPPLTDVELKALKLIGGELTPDNNIKIGDILIDRAKQELIFPGEVNMTKGGLEVLICTGAGRRHESLLVSNVPPMKLQLALILLGAENGARRPGGQIPQGSIIDIDVVNQDGIRVPVEKWLCNADTKTEFSRRGWVFVGSSFTSDGKCLADAEGNLVNTWVSGNTILDNSEALDENINQTVDKSNSSLEQYKADGGIDIFTQNVAPYLSPVKIIMKIRKQEDIK